MTAKATVNQMYARTCNVYVRIHNITYTHTIRYIIYNACECDSLWVCQSGKHGQVCMHDC